jgi:hypothetical protein
MKKSNAIICVREAITFTIYQSACPVGFVQEASIILKQDSFRDNHQWGRLVPGWVNRIFTGQMTSCEITFLVGTRVIVSMTGRSIRTTRGSLASLELGRDLGYTGFIGALSL